MKWCLIRHTLGLIQKLQKERQEKQEKEEEEKKEKQRQEAEEMVRRIHEGSDSLEEQLAAVTEQQETKPSEQKSSGKENAQEMGIGNVEAARVDPNLSDKRGKPGASTSSSEEVDEEALEGEENVSKFGKDGKFLL